MGGAHVVEKCLSLRSARVGEAAESVRVQCRVNFSAAANVIGSQPSVTRNQCRLTIAVQKARVGIERVVFPLFQVS